MKKQPVITGKIIILGITWGILEASLGYLIHLLPGISFLSGMIMFPVGFYLMIKGYEDTKRISTVLIISSIAAGIKLFDLIIPFTIPIQVINPVMAILLESVVTAAAVKFIILNNSSLSLHRAVLISMSWRILFVVFPSLPWLYISQGLLTKSPLVIINFLAVETVGEGIFIYFIYKFLYSFPLQINFRLNPRYSVSVVILAIYLSTRILLFNYLPL